MLRRPESSGRRRESGRTTATWSRTTPSRWSPVRVRPTLISPHGRRVSVWAAWSSEPVPLVLPAPARWPWQLRGFLDNGCNFLSLLPLSCPCFLVLFSEEEAGSHCPPHLPHVDLLGHLSQFPGIYEARQSVIQSPALLTFPSIIPLFHLRGVTQSSVVDVSVFYCTALDRASL